MAEDGPDEGDDPAEDPTEVRVQWKVPAPTPEGEEPATPWGRPGEDDPDLSTAASPSGAPPPVLRPDPASPDPASPDPASPDPVPDPLPDPEGDRRRRALVVAVVAVAAVVALVAGALVVVLVTSDDEDATAKTTTTPPTTAPANTAPAGLSGEVDIGAGITALIPEGALSDDARIEAEPIDLPANVGRLVTPIGDVVQITLVRGEQLAPIGLRFPYTPPPGLPTVDGVVPDGAVFALHRDGGTWVPLPVDLDEAQGTATFVTPSLSPFGLFTWSQPEVGSVGAGVLGSLVGEAAAGTAPSCSGEAPEVTDSGEGDAVAWCTEEAGDGAQLKVSNASDHAVSIHWSEGVEAQVDETTALGEQLTGVETASGDRVVVLGPGARVTFLLPADRAATLTVTYDGSAHAVTGLLAAARLLDRAAPDMPWKGDVTAAELEAAIAAGGCASRLVPDMAVQAEAWRAALGSCLAGEGLADLVPEGAAAPVVALLRQLSEPVVGDHAALVEALRADTDLELVATPG